MFRELVKSSKKICFIDFIGEDNTFWRMCIFKKIENASGIACTLYTVKYDVEGRIAHKVHKLFHVFAEFAVIGHCF